MDTKRKEFFEGKENQEPIDKVEKDEAITPPVRPPRRKASPGPPTPPPRSNSPSAKKAASIERESTPVGHDEVVLVTFERKNSLEEAPKVVELPDEDDVEAEEEKTNHQDVQDKMLKVGC